VRVLGDVDECLLQGLLEHVDRGRSQARRIAAQLEVDRGLSHLPKIAQETLDALRGGYLVQIVRRQVADEPADLPHHETGVLPDLLELRIDGGGRVCPMQAPVELEPHRERELAQGVVQLVRDTGPLADADCLGRLGVQARGLGCDRGAVRLALDRARRDGSCAVGDIGHHRRDAR